MRQLRPPGYSARDIIELCAESIQDPDLSGRLNLVCDAVEAAETVYVQNAESETLFSIPQAGAIGGVSVEEMKRVYKGTFVKSKRTRDIYNTIKKSSVNDICPMCGQRTVGTLDHYLAQSLHPAYIVAPVNLLPSCADCNKAKLDRQPGAVTEQTLHPYFDNVDDAIWLNATIEERPPASLLFFPAPPDAWPEQKRARLLLHFRTFRLGALYGSHSAEELINIRYGLQRIAERGRPDDIRTELLRRAESSKAAQINSWQTAMYYALATSDWYCSGGYN